MGLSCPDSERKEPHVVVGDAESHTVRVLCIVPTPDNSTHPLLIAANDLDALIEIVGDVYTGLARLGNRDAPRFEAVLIDVSDLDATEMDFFDLVSRYHRPIPVYVFAHDPATVKVDQAVARGARGRAELDRLHDLVAAHAAMVDHTTVVLADAADMPPRPSVDADPVRAPNADAPETVAPIEEPIEPPAADIDHDLERRLSASLPTAAETAPAEAEHEEPPADRPAASTTDVPGPAAGEHAADRGEGSKTAKSEKKSRRAQRVKKRSSPSSRVPWGDTESRPQRKAPHGPTGAPLGLPTIKPAPPRPPDDDPPLLSPEELDALVGVPPVAPSAKPTDPDHVP